MVNTENNISYQLQNIFKSGELNKDLVIQKIRVTVSDNKIKREKEEKMALDEYEKYCVVQDRKYISDFDKLVLENKNIELTE